MRMRLLSSTLFISLLAFSHAEATAIVINAGGGLAGNAAALAAFNRAALSLGSQFTDPITVNVNANLAALGPGIIGSTSSLLLTAGYSTIRNAMVADGADEADDAITAALPTAAQFSTTLPAGFSLDGRMVLTQANANALGFGVNFGADAAITFSSAFGFDYDNSDGVGAGLVDFETVALHELIHALGFVSWVDQIDGAAPSATFFTTLDMYRFATANVPTTIAQFTNNARSLVPGASASTSDLANSWRMSTGLTAGDGRQASHWRDDSLSGVNIGVMDPTLGSGVFFGASFADLRALDLIGWDRVQTPAAVPEPTSIVLLGSGVLLLIRRRQRRRPSIN